MLKRYSKVMIVFVVLIFWLWSLTNCFAALSARSDFGVVAGIAGVITSTFACIWVLMLVFKKRENKSEKPSPSGDRSGPRSVG